MKQLVISKIKSEGQMEFVLGEALADGVRQKVAPSHVIMFDGEVRGAMNVVPMALLWLHKERNNAHSCADVLTVLENMLRDSAPAMCIPCEVDSPFKPYMERLGYSKIEGFEFFVKGL